MRDRRPVPATAAAERHRAGLSHGRQVRHVTLSMAPHVAPVPLELLRAALLILLAYAAIVGLLPALLGLANAVAP
jgi:hypothetical protein